MIKLTNKEVNELKREVKRLTGTNINQIVDIMGFCPTLIVYTVYESNYDRVKGIKTTKEVARGGSK